MRAALILILAAVPFPAFAQTPDLVFGGFRFHGRDTGSRPAGLGGAYVALADGVRASAINPAGLALVPDTELSASTADLWAGAARTFKPGPPAPGTPPDCGGRRTRPLAVAVFAEQAVKAGNAVDVIVGPGLSEQGRLETDTEQVGLSVARGVLPWLNAGVTVAWRHLRMDASSATLDLEGRDLRRVIIAGDANKARLTAGLLATFGPSSSPTAFRLGASWQGDLRRWSVERTVLDRLGGTVVSGPERIEIAEPSLLSVGLAWRISDTWTISAQGDQVFYEDVVSTLRRNANDDAAVAGLDMPNGFEPRFAVEATWPSPIGGYFKVRGGVRRETSGRLEYDGPDPAARQAFRKVSAAFRAAGGASLLGEFYERAFRLDLDMSQVVLEPSTTLAAAGLRRFSIGLTVRP